MTHLTAKTSHPGFANKRLGMDRGSVGPLLGAVHVCFARSPEEGAWTLIYPAASPDVEGVNGTCFTDEGFGVPSPTG